MVDDLLSRGYRDITVLDISQTAIDANRKRLAELSNRVKWLVGDITRIELERRPTMYGTIEQFSTFSACRLTVSPMFAKLLKL